MKQWFMENWWWFSPTYLVVSFGFSVLVGKCIAFGMGTDLEDGHGERQ